MKYLNRQNSQVVPIRALLTQLPYPGRMSDNGTPEITIVKRLLIKWGVSTTGNLFLSKAREVYKSSLNTAEKESIDIYR